MIVGTVMTGTCGKPLLQIVILRLAFGQAEPPAVIVDHDADVIRVVEGRGAAIERGVIEVPLRRRDLPDELRKVVPVLVVAGAAAFGGEIVLIPPLELRLRRQRHLAGFLAADQVAAHGDQRLAALRPERRDDIGRPRAPIEAGDVAFSILSASIKAMMSTANADCWPLRNVSLERKRVVP